MSQRIVPSANAVAVFRTRGYNDGWDGADTADGESLARKAGEKCLAAYLDGVRNGRRERKRHEEEK